VRGPVGLTSVAQGSKRRATPRSHHDVAWWRDVLGQRVDLMGATFGAGLGDDDVMRPADRDSHAGQEQWSRPPPLPAQRR